MKNKRYQPDLLARWFPSLVVIGIAYAVCVYFLEDQSLPDYEAYERIFEDPSAYQSWNLFFSSLFGFALRFFSYDYLRSLFLVAGAVFCMSAMSRLRHTALVYLMLCPIIVIFLLEFFQVRLRAGLSIVLFYASFFIGFNDIKRGAIAFPITALSIAIHPATGSTLLLCSGVFVRFFRSQRVRFLLSILGWVSFLIAIDYLATDRGEHLFSEINMARLLAICVMPVVCLLSLRKLKLGYLVEPKIHGIGAVFFCGFATLILYAIGFFSVSGEAIVRVLSLVTGVSLLVSVLTTRLSMVMWSVAFSILALNALFFVNTVYF